MLARIARIIVSLAVSLLPMLYIAGYLSFIPGLPPPGSLLGLNSSGSQGSTATNLFAAGTGFTSLLPFGTFGVSGLVIFTILSRVGSTVSSAVSTPRIRNMGSQFPGMMPNFMMGAQVGGVPDSLPSDLSKSQFVILREFRYGRGKSGDIAKSLSMDKKEVENQISVLKSNGYLSAQNKLTTKALGVLS